ncbi:17954_t:CDS:2 [Entrophospora sp. SA101]|nr:17954_t:CDS:2 [Entrophospora sp. SA101]
MKRPQNIQNILNQKFTQHGTKNVSLPTLIPYSFFQKEKQHIQGFSPEFYQVQQIGDKKLTEPLVLQYQNYVEKNLCLAIIAGKKSENEKFAGALESYTVECLLSDGQCLQLATRTSTRAIGAIAGTHPNIELTNYYQGIYNLLSPVYRCQLYNKKLRVNLNILQADKEGCPLKIILGAEELKKEEITLIKRDDIKRKITIRLKAGRILKIITKEIDKFKKNIYQKSADFRDKHIFPVGDFSELHEKISKEAKGLFLIPFCNFPDCEKTIPQRLPAYSIRCLSLITKSKEKCIFCAAPAVNYAYLGRSY